jgi:hypothetical protein
MLILIFYYLILPFILFGFVLAFLRKFGSKLPKEIESFIASDPIESKFYRAAQMNGRFGEPGATLRKLGDFEKQDEAVDAAFNARKTAGQVHAAYIVLNDKGEILQEV